MHFTAKEDWRDIWGNEDNIAWCGINCVTPYCQTMPFDLLTVLPIRPDIDEWL